jgi:predicted O-linked N-acetylglucosamine transferase (SPINDLY family)
MKPERNNPCPCGSGKKYKKCCGAMPAQVQPANAFLQARQAFESGDFQRAENFCRVLLRQHPQDADTNHLCGVVSYRLGNFNEAKLRLALAVRHAPDNAFLHSNLSLVLRDAGELEAAAASARRAITLNARLAEAHNNFATILEEQGDLDAAAAASRNAINLDSGNALFHANLAGVWLLQGDIEAAERGYRCALELAPTLIPALSGLGALRIQQKQWTEARHWLEKALAVGAVDPMVLNNLGHTLFRLKDTQAAVTLYKQALARKPDFGGAHYNLGLALETLGQKTAVDAFAAALHHSYATWEAIDSFYRVALQFGMIDRVYAHALRLLDEAVFRHELLPSLIAVFGQACDFSARARVWNKFMQLYRDGHVDNETIKLLLGTSLYPANLDEDFVWQLHRSLGAALEAAHADRKYSEYPATNNDKPLRIGYLSPDLRSHSVGLFIQQVIAHHNRDEFEVICYSLSKESDAVTDFIRRHATRFDQVDHLDDAALAQRIHADGIHLLIDLAGYSMHNRVAALARKPAPLQFTWIGYLSSLGLEAVDYRITDPYADDPVTTLGSERLLVLPECFLCLGSFPECAIDPQPPVARNGHVTFASFNNLTKIAPEAVRVWAQVLAGVPGSHLLIASTDADSQAVGSNLHAEFGRHGIAPERLTLRRSLPQIDYLRAHNDIDIILDTWPFNGGTVTAGALWMGVPVVTLVGKAHRQRVGYSLLKNIGVEDTIAWSEAEYVNTAVRLAQDPVRLAALRQTIAANTRHSILCDAPRFTRQVEAALRRAWDEYTAAAAPGSGHH